MWNLPVFSLTFTHHHIFFNSNMLSTCLVCWCLFWRDTGLVLSDTLPVQVQFLHTKMYLHMYFSSDIAQLTNSPPCGNTLANGETYTEGYIIRLEYKATGQSIDFFNGAQQAKQVLDLWLWKRKDSRSCWMFYLWPQNWEITLNRTISHPLCVTPGAHTLSPLSWFPSPGAGL